MWVKNITDFWRFCHLNIPFTFQILDFLYEKVSIYISLSHVSENRELDVKEI